MMKNKIFIIVVLASMFLSLESKAQKFSISSNALDWLDFGTANLELGLSLSQHFSLSVGGQYNPWKFKDKQDFDIYKNQTTAYVGARYWPWYVFSGWWVGVKVQYSDSDKTGIWRPALETAKSLGAGLSAGYTLMLHKNFNIEFSAGLWGGRHLEYILYDCPRCMVVRDASARNFIAIDDVSVSLMYVF